MKALPKFLLALAAVAALSVQPAQAYMVTLDQVGANVVATGSGAINLTGLTRDGFFEPTGDLHASSGIINTGEPARLFGYTGFTGPTKFGSGGLFLPDTKRGDLVGIDNSIGRISVPLGYVSGAPLSDSMTFNNATFASLGVRQGTFVWSWGTGTGSSNQNFTLIIGSGVPTPDGGSTVSLLGCALLGLAALRRKLGC